MQELTEFNLEKITAEVIILKDQMAQNIVEIGKRFILVRDNLQHGKFIDWVTNEVEFSQRTTYNFIKIAEVFSNSNLQPVANLGTRKLLALAGLDEEDRQEVMQENNTEEMTARELEKVVKEKKEIKKQLQAEQEYSEELQQAIKEKEQKIKALQNEIENIQIPEKEIIEKEVIKEVIPQNLILEKQTLEKELKELRKRTEKAENTLSRMKLDKEINQEKVYSNTKLEHLLINIKNFLDSASKYTYLKDELQKIPAQNRKILESKINEVESWTILMKQALRNEENIVGNVIFGEGEIINE